MIMKYPIYLIIAEITFLGYSFIGGMPENNYVYIKINGYIHSCTTIPDVSVMEDGNWRQIQRTLPYKGVYYLDDKYIGYGWCDLETCVKIDSLSVPLIEYTNIGMKKAPPNSEVSEGTMIKEFQTVPLHGEIKIEIQYYSDSTCTKKKMFSQIIMR
jgi:hypothetical protein